MHEERIKAENDLLKGVKAETERAKRRAEQERKDAPKNLKAELEAKIKAAELLKEVAIQESLRAARAQAELERLSLSILRHVKNKSLRWLLVKRNKQKSRRH